MIALIKQPKQKRSNPAWHAAFLKMLPAIVRHANIAFRFMPAEPREEAVAEVTAMCWAAFSRLVERGKQEVASPTALSRYAVAQFRDGRRATGRQSPRDVMSSSAQRRKGFGVEPLKQFDADDETWQEIVEDKRATPAEIAITRIDFASWLKMLPRRSRKIALMLASRRNDQRGSQDGLECRRPGFPRFGCGCGSTGMCFRPRQRQEQPQLAVA